MEQLDPNLSGQELTRALADYSKKDLIDWLKHQSMKEHLTFSAALRMEGSDLFNGVFRAYMKREMIDSHNAIECLDTSYDIGQLAVKRTKSLNIEEGHIVTLTGQLEVIRDCRIAAGSIKSALIDPRQVVRAITDDNASNFVFYHNHPSGRLEPSGDDLDFTGTLKKLGDIMNCSLIDSIITADGNYYSFAEEGKL